MTKPIPIPVPDNKATFITEVSSPDDSLASSLSSNNSLVVGSPNEKKKKKKTNRCKICNKRVGLLGFTCKCDGLFCAQHRHAEQHNCQFDFREKGLNILEKKLVKVDGDKVHNRL